jgi:predicted transcriptional regulator
VIAHELGCSVACITYHVRGAVLRGEITMRGHKGDLSEAHLRGEALLAQGWTQTRVAREVGVSRQRVWQWVREQRVEDHVGKMDSRREKDVGHPESA